MYRQTHTQCTEASSGVLTGKTKPFQTKETELLHLLERGKQAKNHPQAAIFYFQQALQLAQQLQYDCAALFITLELAILYAELHQHWQSTLCLQQTVALAEQLSKPNILNQYKEIVGEPLLTLN